MRSQPQAMKSARELRYLRKRPGMKLLERPPRLVGVLGNKGPRPPSVIFGRAAGAQRMILVDAGKLQVRTIGSDAGEGPNREDIELDGVDARFDHVELSCCAVGEVDDALREEFAAVGDGDDDAAVVAQVGDPDLAAEGQIAVRCCELVHVEAATAGGSVAVENLAIPTGKAALDAGEGGYFGDNGSDDLLRTDFEIGGS